jgi:hypothetical protein
MGESYFRKVSCMSHYLRLVLVFVACSLIGFVSFAPNRPSSKRGEEEGKSLRANYILTTTDDFIVDVYHNGRHVPDSKRELVEEIHGATVEKIKITVRNGDWVVFNVVNNHLRWNGQIFFGVAGCLNMNEFGFVSRADDGNWSACDSPSDVDRFISEPGFLRHRPALKIGNVWGAGESKMKEYAGSSWSGEGIWGSRHNSWVKVNVE